MKVWIFFLVKLHVRFVMLYLWEPAAACTILPCIVCLFDCSSQENMFDTDSNIFSLITYSKRQVIIKWTDVFFL